MRIKKHTNKYFRSRGCGYTGLIGKNRVSPLRKTKVILKCATLVALLLPAIIGVHEMLPVSYKMKRFGCTSAVSSNSYLGMACAAEKINFALGQQALFAIPRAQALRERKPFERIKKSECQTCEEVVVAYGIVNQNYFTRKPYNASNTISLMPRRDVVETASEKRSDNESKNKEKGQLRVDARYLLNLAEKSFKEETSKNLYNALELASLARFLLHAAQPEEEFMKEGGLLHRAIKEYNQYLEAIISSSPADTHANAPYKHKLTSCPEHMDKSYMKETQSLEHLYHNSRNADYNELGMKISMNPYRVLPTFPSVQQRSKEYKRKILLDVGANGFLGSPKALIDMYAPYQKFDEVHMFEPDLKGMKLPKFYTDNYDMHFHQGFVNVGKRDENDVIKFLEENVQEDDFVALKFDVDDGVTEMTMEWGFLSDLIHSKAMRLVDELFIELHFYSAALRWGSSDHHSARQSFDVLRQLRECGVAIHSWP